MPDNTVDVKLRATDGGLSLIMRQGADSVEQLLSSVAPSKEKLEEMAAGLLSDVDAASKLGTAFNKLDLDQIKTIEQSKSVIVTIESLGKAYELAAEKLREQGETEAAARMDRLAESFEKLKEKAVEAGEKIPESHKELAESVKGYVESPMNSAKSAVESFVLNLGSVNAVAAIATGTLIGVGLAAAESALHVLELSHHFEVLSLELGVGVENVQLWSAMADVSGAKANAMMGAIRILSKVMEDTSDAGIALRVKLQDIGVEFYNAEGGLRSLDEVFPSVIRSLAEMEAGSERNRLVMQALGRSGATLLPLGEGFDHLSDAVRKTNVVIGEEAVKANASYMKSLELMKKEVAGTWNTIGENVVKGIVLTRGFFEIMHTLPKIGFDATFGTGKKIDTSGAKEHVEEVKHHLEEVAEKNKEILEKNKETVEAIVASQEGPLAAAEKRLKDAMSKLKLAAGKPGDVSGEVEAVREAEAQVQAIKDQTEAQNELYQATRRVVAARRQNLEESLRESPLAKEIVKAQLSVMDMPAPFKADAVEMAQDRIKRALQKTTETMIKDASKRAEEENKYEEKAYQDALKKQIRELEGELRNDEKVLANQKRFEDQQQKVRDSAEKAEEAHQHRMAEIEKLGVELMFASGQITAVQKLQMLSDIERRQEQILLRMASQQVDAAAVAGTDIELQTALNKEQTLRDQARIRQLKLDVTFAQQTHRVWSSAVMGITQDFGRMATSVLSGQQTMFGAMIGFADQWLSRFIENLLMATAATIFHSEEQKSVQQLNAAKTAAANTYSAISAIPIVGPFLAPPAAAAAFAAVLAFEKGGEVPNDTIAFLHKKEMVLPAPVADTVRERMSASSKPDQVATPSQALNLHYYAPANVTREDLAKHADFFYGIIRKKIRASNMELATS